LYNYYFDDQIETHAIRKTFLPFKKFVLPKTKTNYHSMSSCTKNDYIIFSNK